MANAFKPKHFFLQCHHQGSIILSSEGLSLSVLAKITFCEKTHRARQTRFATGDKLIAHISYFLLHRNKVKKNVCIHANCEIFNLILTRTVLNEDLFSECPVMANTFDAYSIILQLFLSYSSPLLPLSTLQNEKNCFNPCLSLSLNIVNRNRSKFFIVCFLVSGLKRG